MESHTLTLKPLRASLMLEIKRKQIEKEKREKYKICLSSIKLIEIYLAYLCSLFFLTSNSANSGFG